MKTAHAILGGLIALGVGAGAAHATTYDLAADFSTAANPNGVWSYGYEDTLGGAFHLYPNVVAPAGFPGWGDTSVPGFSTYSVPSDFHNPTGAPVTGGTITLAAGQAAFHPGEADQISLYRFTAPASGTYALSASFAGGDNSGNTRTTVTILKDNIPVYTGNVLGDGPGSVISTAQTLTLGAGDTVDFGVGQYLGQFFYDTTTISAQLSSVAPIPEPAGLSLLAAGLLGVLAARVRKRG
jgi:hypothetical protein